jgi:hypothetical protein
MEFTHEASCQILERTPAVLRSLLTGIDEQWIINNEGPETFSPYDVVGHLIHGELSDWPDRARLILGNETPQPFVPFDRFAMYEESKGKTLQQMLDEFESLRAKNMKWYRSLDLTAFQLAKKGIHPKFGEVTLKQLLSTWVVHDLTHIAQITRVMAKQYKEEVGPWVEFFRVLNF